MLKVSDYLNNMKDKVFLKRLIVMLKNWRKPADKNAKYNVEHKISDEYWKGQISIIDSLLKVLEIFK